MYCAESQYRGRGFWRTMDKISRFIPFYYGRLNFSSKKRMGDGGKWEKEEKVRHFPALVHSFRNVAIKPDEGRDVLHSTGGVNHSYADCAIREGSISSGALT